MTPDSGKAQTVSQQHLDPVMHQPPTPPQHSSQGGKAAHRKGQGPLGTWLVIGILTISIFMMWFLVLGIMEARN